MTSTNASKTITKAPCFMVASFVRCQRPIGTDVDGRLGGIKIGDQGKIEFDSSRALTDILEIAVEDMMTKH